MLDAHRGVSALTLLNRQVSKSTLGNYSAETKDLHIRSRLDVVPLPNEEALYVTAVDVLVQADRSGEKTMEQLRESIRRYAVFDGCCSRSTHPRHGDCAEPVEMNAGFILRFGSAQEIQKLKSEKCTIKTNSAGPGIWRRPKKRESKCNATVRPLTCMFLT